MRSNTGCRHDLDSAAPVNGGDTGDVSYSVGVWGILVPGGKFSRPTTHNPQSKREGSAISETKT